MENSQMKNWCNDDERIDDLHLNGLSIIQNKNDFCFGIDAVLLSDFVDVKKDDVVLDFGTGTGIIPILLSNKSKAKKIIGIEVQKKMSEMAQRSVEMNGLNDLIEIRNMDIKDSIDNFNKSIFDVIVSNPPYFKKNGGITNPSDSKKIARHEILITLEEIIYISSKLLKPGGQLALVHKPERLVDIVFEMRNNGIEPKYIRFVHPYPDKKANLILIKGNRGGNPELKMMEPLYVYEKEGEYSSQINKIYHRGGY